MVGSTPPTSPAPQVAACEDEAALPVGWEVGRRIGPYLLTGLLGEGGMSLVFAALNEHIVQEVAIKILRPDPLRARDDARLLQEGRALALLQHPGIVRVLSCDRAPDGVIYLVMERLAGITLRQWLAQRRAPSWSALCELGAQAAAALAAAHRQHIIHRDLTPANLLLVPDSGLPSGLRVKVVDFGLVKLQPKHALPAEHTQIETASGQFLGTPHYMPPEQIRDASSITARSDVYALGVVLYECLSGAPPFAGEAIEVLADHLRSAPLDLRRRVPGLPQALTTLIGAMLAKEPLARPSMDEVEGSLRALCRPVHVPWRRGGVALLGCLCLLMLLGRHHDRPASAPTQPEPRAELLLNQVLFDAKRWLGDVDWSLAQLPGTLEGRQQVLTRLHTTLAALAPQDRERPEVRRWIIEAQHRMGDLAFHHGTLAQAQADYAAAQTLLEEGSRRAPLDEELRLLEALNASKRGKLALAQGRAADAERCFADAVQSVQAHFGVSPAELEVRRILSVSLQEQGALRVLRGRPAEAMQSLREAVALLKESRDDYDGWLRAEASLQLGLALGAGPKAEVVLRQALDEQRLRARREPANLMFRWTEARLLEGLAALHQHGGRAQRLLQEALVLGREIQTRDPTNKRYALLRCQLLLRVAEQSSQRARWDAHEECRAIVDQFALRDAQDRRLQQLLDRFPVR